MNIEQRLTNNRTAGRDGRKAVAVVEHVMAGTLDGTDAWFHNHTSSASAHFGVGRDGRVFQWVELQDTAWHAGDYDHPNTALALVTMGWQQRLPANLWTVGVEHEGNTGDGLTPVQFATTVQLHLFIKAELERLGVGYLQFTPQTLLQHAHVNSATRAGCPGTGFPMASLFGALKGA